MVLNSAFVFLKPAAVTDKMKELVKDIFEKKGIKVLKEGTIPAEEIDKNQFIDKHYYAIASKATLLTPDKLNVPADKFKKQFGLEWADVLKDGKALNAKDACEKFGIDADEIAKMWDGCKKAGDLVKLGGGFYCGKLEKDGKGPFYVFNAFFMSMRAGFVKPGTCIYYYTVEWNQKDLAWEDFRGKVLGPTDPKDAPKDSLRGGALADWKNLGLASEPNTGENCAHASASPFEGLCEKMNWLKVKAEKDPWGKALLDAGVSMKTIKEWSLDPAVTYGEKLNPTVKSIWDTVEDMDAKPCIDKCAEIATWKPLRKAKFGKVGKIKPDMKGLNFYMKCVTAAAAVEDSNFKEALCGDDTGAVVLSLSEEQAALCTTGALLRIQNARARMVKGHIRLTMDKWAVIKKADSVEFEKVNEETNVSKTEYELK
jgi:nucleoside diphosphate kinase